MEKIIKVKGMHCNSCALLLKDVISEINGVSVVSADYKTGSLKVRFSEVLNDYLFSKIKSAIEKEGYEVVE